ncbi:MAG: hypothetical protein ACE5EA_04950 [Nitrospirota bacterium]
MTDNTNNNIKKSFPLLSTVYYLLPTCLFRISIIIAALLIFPAYLYAESRFSMGPLSGVYYPALDTLNNVIANPKIALLQDPNFLLPRNPDFPSELRNISMSEIKGSINYGVEGQWKITDEYSLHLALSVWEGETFKTDRIKMFTRSNVPPRIVPRDARYTLTMTQIWFGWRYNMFHSPDRSKIYLTVGMAGLTLANFTMDAMVKVVSPELSFASTSSTESFGWGFTTRFGLGGEYFFKKWGSVGLNINYILADVIKLTVQRTFIAGFPDIPPQPPEANPRVVVPEPPDMPEYGDKITYATVTSEENRDLIEDNTSLRLEIDGFEIVAGIRLYF